jgi:mannose-6-phosphate isomerase-like protein (cupin superfamily)
LGEARRLRRDADEKELNFASKRNRENPMANPIRRVVTGHNEAGKSIFVMDGPAPNTHCRSPGSSIVTEMWETRGSPADNQGNDEVTDHPYHIKPPANGTIFRIIQYPPDKERLASLERERHSSAGLGDRADVLDRGNPRHPGFHKTASVDYAIVLSGEIYALMDEGEVLLKTGDVLIQRGTNHAWSNRTDEPAFVAFVLIDAAPL